MSTKKSPVSSMSGRFGYRFRSSHDRILGPIGFSLGHRPRLTASLPPVPSIPESLVQLPIATS